MSGCVSVVSSELLLLLWENIAVIPLIDLSEKPRPPLIKGVDLDFSALLPKGFSLGWFAEYLDAVFDSFPNAPTSNPSIAVTEPVTFGSAAGNQLPSAPRVVATLSGNYETRLYNSDIDAHVTVLHSTPLYFEPDNVIQQRAYTQVNARVHWGAPGGRMGVSLWGENLTNVAVLGFAGTLADGLRTTNFAPPRTYGITVSYHLE